MSADTALAARFAEAGLDWIVPEWPAPPRARAFSTTRTGGVSAGPRASLDLGRRAARHGEDSGADALAENRKRLAAFLPAAPVWLDQCHGVDVAAIDRESVERARSAPPRADAAVTGEPGVVLAVLTADCLPVVLADRRSRALGIAHAGWRGLAAGVVEATVGALPAAPADLVAWLGPAIGLQAFEVGADVVDAFCRQDEGARMCFRPRGGDKWLADLRALARRRLDRAGVHEIHGADLCTYSDAGRFFSHRRDPRSGRMATLAWLDMR